SPKQGSGPFPHGYHFNIRRLVSLVGTPATPICTRDPLFFFPKNDDGGTSQQPPDHVIDADAVILVDPILDLPNRILVLKRHSLRPSFHLRTLRLFVCQQGFA